MKYLLMNKDNVVAEVTCDTTGVLPVFMLGQVFGKLPMGFKEINI